MGGVRALQVNKLSMLDLPLKLFCASLLLMPLMFNRLHLNIFVSICNNVLELHLHSLQTSGCFRNIIQNVFGTFMPLMQLLHCVPLDSSA